MESASETSVKAQSKRVEWVDTAKGICILLVVLHHCAQLLQASYPLQRVFLTFRMPLYFILSGLFFKNYSFKTFILKKTNKLLIPYVFFYVVTGVLIPVAVYKLFGFSLALYDSYGLEAILSVFSERVICNPSIWFLFCLFEVNVYFYLLYFISGHFKNSSIVLGFFSLILGLVGLFLAYKRIGLPYFVDSSLTALPFFYFGYYLRNHTSILTSGNTKSSICYSIAFIVGSFLMIGSFNYGLLSMFENLAGGLKGCAQVYPYGIMGTMSVLFLSKLLGKVPLLSYIGRYSIIVLCTHIYVIDLMVNCIKGMNNVSLKLAIVFISTVVICALIIPLFKKYLGYFTAQKDLIKIS